MGNCALPAPSCRLGTACEGGRGSMVPCKADAGPEAWTPPQTQDTHHKDSHKYLGGGGGIQFAGNEPVGNLAYLVHRLVAEISPFQNKIQDFSEASTKTYLYHSDGCSASIQLILSLALLHARKQASPDANWALLGTALSLIRKKLAYQLLIPDLLCR